MELPASQVAGEGRDECLICMEKCATVVFVPCNHLLACQDCVERFKKTANNSCPMCRREINYEQNF